MKSDVLAFLVPHLLYCPFAADIGIGGVVVHSHCRVHLILLYIARKRAAAASNSIYHDQVVSRDFLLQSEHHQWRCSSIWQKAQPHGPCSLSSSPKPITKHKSTVLTLKREYYVLDGIQYILGVSRLFQQLTTRQKVSPLSPCLSGFSQRIRTLPKSYAQ